MLYIDMANKLGTYFLLGLCTLLNLSLFAQTFGVSSFTKEEHLQYRKAYRAYSGKNYQTAIMLFDSLLQHHSSHCEMLSLKGASLYELDMINQALLVYQQTLDCYYEDPFTHEQIGYIYNDLGENEKAKFYYMEALRFDNSSLHYKYLANISILLVDWEKYSESLKYLDLWISDCQQSVTPESSCSDVWYQRAKSYHHLEKDSLALIDIDRHLETYSDDSVAIALKKNIETCLLEN